MEDLQFRLWYTCNENIKNFIVRNMGKGSVRTSLRGRGKSSVGEIGGGGEKGTDKGQV